MTAAPGDPADGLLVLTEAETHVWLFYFHYPSDDAVAMTIDPELADDAARWQFWQLRPASNYLVAICAERLAAQSPCVIVRQAVPMLSEREIVPRFLRVSEQP